MPASGDRTAREKINDALKKAEERNKEIEALLQSEDAPVAGSEARGKLVTEYLRNKGIIADSREAAQAREQDAEKEFDEILRGYAAHDKDADGDPEQMREAMKKRAENPDANDLDKSLNPENVLAEMKKQVHEAKFTPVEAALTAEGGLDEIDSAYDKSIGKSKAYNNLMNAQNPEAMAQAFAAVFGFSFKGMKQEKKLSEERAESLSESDSEYEYSKAKFQQGLFDKYEEPKKLEELMEGMSARHKYWFPQDWADSSEMSDLKTKTRALYNKTQETGIPREDDPDYGKSLWDVMQASMTYSNIKKIKNTEKDKNGPGTRMGRERLQAVNKLNDHVTSQIVRACLKNRGRKLSPEDRQTEERRKTIGLNQVSQAFEKLRPGKIMGVRHKDSLHAVLLREKAQKLQQAMRNARVPVTSDPYVIEAMIEANQASTYYLQKKAHDSSRVASGLGKERDEAAKMLQKLTRDMMIEGMKTDKAREQERKRKEERERSHSITPEPQPDQVWHAPDIEKRENEAEHTFAARQQANKLMETCQKELADRLKSARQSQRGEETTKALMSDSAAKVIAIHNCMDEIGRDPQKWQEDLARDGENALANRVEAETDRMQRDDPRFRMMMERLDSAAIGGLAANLDEGKELPGTGLQDAYRNPTLSRRRARQMQQEVRGQQAENDLAPEQRAPVQIRLTLDERLNIFRRAANNSNLSENDRCRALKHMIVCEAMVRENGADAPFDQRAFEAARVDLAKEQEFSSLRDLVDSLRGDQLNEAVQNPQTFREAYQQGKNRLAERRGPDYQHPIEQIEPGGDSLYYMQVLNSERVPAYANDRETVHSFALSQLAAEQLRLEGQLVFDEQAFYRKRAELENDQDCRNMFAEMEFPALVEVAREPGAALQELLAIKRNDPAFVRRNHPVQPVAEPPVPEPELPPINLEEGIGAWQHFGSWREMLIAMVKETRKSESQLMRENQNENILAAQIAADRLVSRLGDNQPIDTEEWNKAFRSVKESEAFRQAIAGKSEREMLDLVHNPLELSRAYEREMHRREDQVQVEAPEIAAPNIRTYGEQITSMDRYVDQYLKDDPAQKEFMKTLLAQKLACQDLKEYYGDIAARNDAFTEEFKKYWTDDGFQDEISRMDHRQLYDAFSNTDSFRQKLKERQIMEQMQQVQHEPERKQEEAKLTIQERLNQVRESAEKAMVNGETEGLKESLAEIVALERLAARSEENKNAVYNPEHLNAEIEAVGKNTAFQNSIKDDSPAMMHLMIEEPAALIRDMEKAEAQEQRAQEAEVPVVEEPERVHNENQPERNEMPAEEKEPDALQNAADQKEPEKEEKIRNREQEPVHAADLNSIAGKHMDDALLTLKNAYGAIDNTRQRGSASDMKEGLAHILAVRTVQQEFERNPQKMGGLTDETFADYVDRYSQRLLDPKKQEGKALNWMTKTMDAEKAFETANAQNKDMKANGNKLMYAYSMAVRESRSRQQLQQKLMAKQAKRQKELPENERQQQRPSIGGVH